MQKQNLRYEQKQSTANARSHEPDLNEDQQALKFNPLIVSESQLFNKT